MKMKMRYFYLMVTGSILSHFILYTPSNLQKKLYEGTLVSVFISLSLSCINAYMLMYVYNRYKDNNLVEMNNRLFGKLIGLIFNLIHLILNITISFFMFRGLIEIIKQYMLPSTSIYVIALFLIILPYANLLNNEKSYMRYISLISAIMIPYMAIQIIIVMKNINYDYLTGAIMHAKLTPNLESIAVAGNFFSGVSFMSIFNPVLGRLDWKKTCLLFINVGLIVAFSTILLPVGIWGPLAVQRIQIIWVATSDALSINLFLIERALYVFLPLFFLLGASQVLNYGFVGYSFIKIMIPNRKIDLVLVNILGGCFIVFSAYIKETELVLRYGTNVIVVAFYTYHILSLLLFIACKVRERRTNNEKVS